MIEIVIEAVVTVGWNNFASTLFISLAWTSKYCRLDSSVCWIGCRLLWPMGTVASKAHIPLLQNRQSIKLRESTSKKTVNVRITAVIASHLTYF
jgi:hypothetical protein